MQPGSDLEKEFVEHFRKAYISKVEENSYEQVYKIMVEGKYGAGARNPFIPVDWKKVLEENKCPFCPEMISLTEKGYSCTKCGFIIPLQLWDKAIDERKRGKGLKQELIRLLLKAHAQGLGERQIAAYKEVAEDEAAQELESKKTKQDVDATQNRDKMSGDLHRRSGITIRKTGGGDERK